MARKKKNVAVSTHPRSPASRAARVEHRGVAGDLVHSVTARQYKHGFLSLLCSYYYPSSQKDIARRDQHPRWITAACDVAVASPSENLKDTLLANALALISQTEVRKDLFTAAMHHYTRAVRNLMSRIALLFSQTIAAVAQDQLDVILIMTQSCGMYEVCFLNRSLVNGDLTESTRQLLIKTSFPP